MRIKVTQHGNGYTNTTYVYRRPDGTWGCTNRTMAPLSLWYAGIENEAECRFALDDATTVQDALKALRQHSRSTTRYTYEPLGAEA